MNPDVPLDRVLQAVRSNVAVPAPRPAVEDEHHCWCPDCREKALLARRAER